MASFRFSFSEDVQKIQVSSDSSVLISQLIEVFTVPNPQYFYMQTKGYNFVDESLSAISTLGTFRCGLFPLVYKSALKLVNGDKSRIEIDENDKERIMKLCMPLKGMFGDDYEVEQIDESRSLRWYQKDAVISLLKYGRGICVSPTSSGKSYIQATLINEIRKNGFPSMEGRNTILVLVPTRQLVDQLYGDFIEYGLKDVCMYTSNSGSKREGTFRDNSCSNGFANVIITNHTWINKKYKNEDFQKLKIGCVLADEVHTVSYKTQALKLVEKLNPSLRFGFTGTLPDDTFDRWVTFGTFGIPVFVTEIKTLQDEKYITPLEVHPIYGMVQDMVDKKKCPFSIVRTVRLNDVLDDGTVVDVGTAYSMELKYIEENAKKIYPPVFKLISDEFDFKTHNAIVLFDRTNIGHALEEELKKLFGSECNILYTDGSTDISIREEIRAKLENSVGNILIAQTVTASTGLNIKNLHGIVFAFSGRSYVRVIQSIGRVLRLAKDKSVAKLYEVWYNMRYSSQHHDEKMEILKTTYGEDSIKPTKRLTI